MILVYCACGSGEEADRIACRLVEEQLAACVNVIGPVRSHYRWEGKMECSTESLLAIKTESRLFDRVRTRIEELHSYDLPEVIAVPVVAGSERYMAWVSGELKTNE